MIAELPKDLIDIPAAKLTVHFGGMTAAWS